MVVGIVRTKIMALRTKAPQHAHKSAHEIDALLAGFIEDALHDLARLGDVAELAADGADIDADVEDDDDSDDIDFGDSKKMTR